MGNYFTIEFDVCASVHFKIKMYDFSAYFGNFEVLTAYFGTFKRIFQGF
jgi:hypothetical protein